MVSFRHLPKAARLFRVLSFCAFALGLMGCGELAVFLSQPQTIKTSEGFQSVEVGEDGYFHISWDSLGDDPKNSAEYDLYLLKTLELPTTLKASNNSLRLSNELVTITAISREDALALDDRGILLTNLKGLQNYTHQEKIDPKSYYVFSIRAKSNKVSARSRIISAKVNFNAPAVTRSSWNREATTLSWDYVPGATGYDVFDAADESKIVVSSQSTSAEISFAQAAESKNYCVRARRGALSSDDCIAIAGVGNQWQVRIAEIFAPTANSGYYRAGDSLEISVRFSNPVSLNQGASAQLPLYMGSLAQALYVSGSGTDTLKFRYTILAGDVSLGLLPVPELIVSPANSLVDSSARSVDLSIYRFHYENSKNVKIDADPPTLNAGADRSATAPINLVATTHGASKFSWSQVSGPGTAQFAPSDKASTEFSAVGDGLYVIRLSVEDDSGLTAQDDIQINWDSNAPIVNVGPDQNFNSATLLDASTSGGSTYQWTKISGPGTITFGTATAEDTIASASAEGDYVLRLTVTDALGNIGFDEMTMTWDVTPPSVNAGIDRYESAAFILTGSSSGATSWAWTIVSSPGSPANVTLDSPNSVSTQFNSSDDGSFVLRLTASDAAGNSASDDVTIILNAKPPSFAGINSIVVTNALSEATISWNSANDVVTSGERIIYDICQTTTSGGCTSLFAATYSTAPGRLNYTVRGLNPSARYEFMVRARDDRGNRDSNVAMKSMAAFSGAASLSLGFYHSCSLMGDGTVQCWGMNSSGQLGDGTLLGRAAPKAVTGLSNVTALASGSFHSCALISDGTVRCWGSNSSKQLADNTVTRSSSPLTVAGLSGVTAIKAAFNQTCALTNAPAVYCWGNNASGVLGNGGTTTQAAPTLVTVVSGVASIAMGFAHTCALLNDATVSCWGDNTKNQLGDNTTTSRLTAAAVSGLAGVTAIFANEYHSCALIGSSLRCWGENDYGQLGDSSTSVRAVPVTPSGMGSGVAAVSMGEDHTCAIMTTTGQAKCWGYSGSAETGSSYSSDNNRNSPTDVYGLTGATAIASSGYHSCAVMSDSKVRCWGSNGSFALGSEFGINQSTPKVLPGLPNDIVQVNAGGYHSCALTATGTIYCWGANTYGQMGDASYFQRGLPVAVSGITTATQIGVGTQHSCARLADTTVRCWGQNNAGQHGSGNNSEPRTPNTATGLTGVKTVHAALDRSCAVMMDGTAKCWGSGTNGAIGDGGTSNRNTATTVTGLSDVKYISMGAGATCAQTNAGPIYCWGDNTYGQLGDGTTTHRSLPTLVTNVSNATKIVQGSWSACAILSDKTVKCWGLNSDGQLGNGTVIDSVAAVTVSGLTDVEDISLYARYACARTGGGVVKCWGDNAYTQLGNGSSADSSIPVNTVLGEVAQLGIGFMHGCVLHTDKAVSCWGLNSYNQLGIFDTRVPWEVVGQ